MKETGLRKSGIFFQAYGSARQKQYPAWRYHKHLEPVIVNNTQEDVEIRAKGYKHLDLTVERKSFLFNHMVDLEDFTPRQLSVYIKDEYGIDLPAVVGVEKLIQAIWKLTVNNPENKDRVVLLAQSIEMNYDETVAEIYKMANGFEETIMEEISV